MNTYLRHQLHRVAALLFGACVMLVSSLAATQTAGDVAEAKRLYADAAYEEALALLGATESADARQYRALCLLALGRIADAERELAALVGEAPSFAVSTGDMPPRFVAMFGEAKRSVLPDLIKQAFARGREDFLAKAHDPARQHFGRVVALSQDAAVSATKEVADLRLLAAGFIDLLESTASAGKIAEVPTPVAPAPAVISAEITPKSAGATAPVVIRQDIPDWPSRRRPSVSAKVGVVRVLIGADGSVKEASMQTPIDPLYDRAILAAARAWRYRPAEWNGKSMEAEKLITITTDAR